MSNLGDTGRSKVTETNFEQAFAAFDQLPPVIRQAMTEMAMPVDDPQVLEFWLKYGTAMTMVALRQTDQFFLKDRRRIVADAISK